MSTVSLPRPFRSMLLLPAVVLATAAPVAAVAAQEGAGASDGHFRIVTEPARVTLQEGATAALAVRVVDADGMAVDIPVRIESPGRPVS